MSNHKDLDIIQLLDKKVFNKKSYYMKSCCVFHTGLHFKYISTRYHSRFFVQVGHETTYAAIGNHHFFTKTCHRQTYQNY